MAELRRSARPRVLLAFAVVYVVWGSTYLAIRVAIETIPPLLMAGVRFWARAGRAADERHRGTGGLIPGDFPPFSREDAEKRSRAAAGTEGVGGASGTLSLLHRAYDPAGPGRRGTRRLASSPLRGFA